MITIGYHPVLRNRALLQWKKVPPLLKKIEKLRPLGFYVEVEELTVEEAALTAKLLRKQQVDGLKMIGELNDRRWLVSVYGPRILTPQLKDRYFIVQVDKEGNAGVSRMMRQKEAISSPPGRGCTNYICKVVGVKKADIYKPKLTGENASISETWTVFTIGNK